MDKTVLLFVNHAISNRHRFVFDFIFSENLGLDYQYTSDITHFLQAKNSIKLNYSGKPKDTSVDLTIYNSGFLEEKKLRSFIPEVHGRCEDLILFPNPNANSCVFGFDVFSAIFYLLSRYEEYQSFKPDSHDRFTALQSIASKYGFLKIPLVDIWIQKLTDLFNKQFKLNIRTNKFLFHPTYDIDIAWAFKNKGILRNINLLARLLKTQNKEIRNDIIQVISNKKKDPYQVFDIFERYRTMAKTVNPSYFFAVGKWSNYDKNTPLSNRQFRKLIQFVSTKNTVGIHPSYKSNYSENRLSTEIKGLASVLKNPVKISRQHYLKLRFPKTYRNLENLKIEEDYTLGYSDSIGFRASTARSFLWYDLQKERISSLRLYPFQVMDVSLFNYMQLNCQEAEKEISNILKMIKTYGGTFRTIWHNSSFYDLEGWTEERQELYKSIYKMAAAEMEQNN
jgi:hypothetical protein